MRRIATGAPAEGTGKPAKAKWQKQMINDR